MALGSTQSLTEMSTRNIPGGKGRPVRKANNLTTICGSLDHSQLYGPVTGIALPFISQRAFLPVAQNFGLTDLLLIMTLFCFISFK
jgi:hypothetical protein